MKRKFGIFMMIMGTALITAALALFLHNRQEQDQAAQAVEDLMPQLVEAILEQKQATVPGETAGTEPQVQEMTVVEINGYSYIGFVGIPSLGLELPVMADWSYPKLQVSPCRFTGSIYTQDLVVMAHNYPKHFGNLKDLRAGDTVTFTDMDGQTLYYEVKALDILDRNAVEDMIAGEFDLTLFTCTYGGQSRIAVRCDRTGSTSSTE